MITMTLFFCFLGLTQLQAQADKATVKVANETSKVASNAVQVDDADAQLAHTGSIEEMTEREKDSIIYSKLSADQILQLKNKEAQIEMERIQAESRNEMPLNGFFITLISIAPFIFVILLIFISNRSRERERIRKYDLYHKSLEMGQTIPESFFDEPEKKRKGSNLQRGIIFLMVGLALVIASQVGHFLENFMLIGGIIPAMVGIGYILVHFLEKPKNPEENKAE